MMISIKEAIAKLNKINDGKIFAVTFIKRTNGEIRKMVCRKGVSKGVNGTGLAFEPNKKGLIGVFDMQKKSYRFISVEAITRVAIEKEVFEVV